MSRTIATLSVLICLAACSRADAPAPPSQAENVDAFLQEPLSPDRLAVLRGIAEQAERHSGPHLVEEESTNTHVLVHQPMEQVPAELSIVHFAQMELEGTDFTLEHVLAEEDVYTRHAIRYLSNGLTISGILNIPHGDGPFPLVVLNHGYITPSVYTRGRGLKREQDYLARRGFAVLHPDYRGHAASDPSPDERHVYDAGLEYSMDVVNAIQAIRAANLPSVATASVGMLGHSLGGGVALNIATAKPGLIDGLILYAPVSSHAWDNFSRWRDMRDETDRTVAVLGTAEQNPGDWSRLSSYRYLNNIRTPVLVFHGGRDKDVPQSWSDELVTRLEELDIDNEYVTYPAEAHEFILSWEDFMQRSAEFLQANLQSGS